MDSLFILRDMYHQHTFVRKEDFITILVSSLQERMLYMDTEGENFQNDTSFSALAHFILRKLKWYEWVDVEHKEHTFDEYIILRSYAAKILNLLYELSEEDIDKYNNYVYNTYTLLKAADQERDEYMYMALVNAHKTTYELKDTMINLLNNIRIYHQQILKNTEVYGLLNDHFNNFKQNITDKIYYPLKTFDSLPKFKMPILKYIKNWTLDTKIIDILAEGLMKRKGISSHEEAIDKVIIMMNEIVDIYESLEDVISEIDNRHTGYTRVSIEKIQYLLNTDRSIKGKIVDILQACSSSKIGKSKLLEKLQTSANIFRQEYFDEYSLYEKVKHRGKVEFQPISYIEEISNNDIDNEIESFKRKLRDRYTHKKIMEYIGKQFKERNEITSKDIDIETMEEFIMLIFATLKNGEKDVTYNLEILEDYLRINGYRIPNIKFIRKEH